MSDTPTPAQDSAEQLKRDANEIRSGTMSPPEMALKLVIVMRRAINRVEELEQQQRHGAEALETLDRLADELRMCAELHVKPSDRQILEWASLAHRALLAPTREGR